MDFCLLGWEAVYAPGVRAASGGPEAHLHPWPSIAEECAGHLSPLPRAALSALTPSLLRSLAIQAWEEANIDWTLAQAASAITAAPSLGSLALPSEDLSAEGVCPLVSILDAPRPRGPDSLALLGSDGSPAAGAVVCRVPDPIWDPMEDPPSHLRLGPTSPSHPVVCLPMPFRHGDSWSH